MKNRYLLSAVLLWFTLADAQFYPRINTLGDVGIGYKFERASPYLGLSYSGYYNQVGDTVFSHNVIVSPHFGINFVMVENPIDVFWDFRLGTTLYTNNIYNDFIINPRWGIGIEKAFNHFAIAGEICANYSLEKYEINSHTICYFHQFSLVPEMALKYYISRNKSNNLP
jgi:hypothetical protein